jgi:cytochrome c
MKETMLQRLNSYQNRSQDQISLHSSRAFLVGFGAVILILVAIIGFPRISRAEADTLRGKQLFEKRCTGCHSLDQDKEGPRLRGVYGRQAGKVSGFKYSAGLQSSVVTWDDASLDKWLTNPDSLIADNDMAFRVVKPDERADIIRFLKAVSLK